jgi:hypothetical protein
MTQFEQDLADGFETEMAVFGSEQFISEDYHSKYQTLYTEVGARKFCPCPDKCSGCERMPRQNMDFIEVVYSKHSGLRVEAEYHSFNFGRSKTETVSTCCLAESIDRPSGFYCRECQEEY